MTNNSGLVDPIRAAEKGAPVAILRVEVQLPPYALMAKATVKAPAGIKGKLISVGGAKDIARIYVEQMLESARREGRRIRSGLCRRDVARFCGAAVRRG